MADPTAVYQVQISGLWSSVHTLSSPGPSTGTAEPAGVLTIQRNGWGTVVGGRFVPGKGEVVQIRRDPGLLRSQFSLWTEGREWLGSSLRWHVFRREVVLHTGSKPLRILPLSGLRAGWTLQAPKTGEMARISGWPLSRKARIEVYRKVDMELLVFSYFLGSQLLFESLWPGPDLVSEQEIAAPPRAAGH